MNYENINQILDRKQTENEITKILLSFDKNINNVAFKKGIYIYGSPGCGKSTFVYNLLKKLNYDIIKYDAGDIRNKSLIDTITSNNVSSRNVLDMMNRSTKKIAIIMDEIDGMNNGDKGGITALIKLIRQKKTKKQKLENYTLNPIICIGNYYIDKKIRELMKVCNTFELKTPTNFQIKLLLNRTMPDISKNLYDKIIIYSEGDLRKLNFIYKIYKEKPDILNSEIIQDIFQCKSYNEDAKNITKTLINSSIQIKDHNKCMNETDRTIVALLWHENIIDPISNMDKNVSIPFYLKILDNMCYADFIDRITFQNQIWQFNEMSSLMKTFYNNKIYHDTFPENKNKYQNTDIRFTKVLTKYSTEYNNILFIYNLCQELDIDKKDLISMFQEFRLQFGMNFNSEIEKMTNFEKLFENYNINKLDIKRIYRYLDKNVKKEKNSYVEDESSDDFNI